MTLRERPSAVPGLACLVWLGLVLLSPPTRAQAPDTEWPAYGGDAGGTRYVALGDITRENVSRLEIAWEHHSGDVCAPDSGCGSTTAYELTPILVGGWLYACTPFNRVLAIHPATGEERWAFDPEIDVAGRWANQLICRGVAHYRDASAVAGSVCAERILTNTLDSRLIALDAATGKPCPGFGVDGEVDLALGVGMVRWKGEYSHTSAPVVIGDVVVVGSAVGDNVRTNAPSGVVRGYDVRTGALRWAFDPAPPDVAPGGRSPAGWALSSPNVWAPMSVDEERDLVFLPTGNPTPDYASKWREGLDTFGSAVIAVRGSTGERVWSFQTVHGDLWDFDLPAQPTLFDLERDGRRIPALVQPTKMGLLFTLDREDGTPLFPVEERPVPPSDDGDLPVSPTQPFPTKPPPLIRHTIGPEDAWGVAFFDTRACRRWIESLRFEGVYTPPSRQGTIMLPGNAGGSNWGGVSVDTGRQLLIANVMDLPFVVTLIPREDFDRVKRENPGVEISPQDGARHGMRRETMLSPLGLPCSKPPWGKLVAVDLEAGDIRWEVPLGTVRDIAPLPIPWKAGVPNIGGPLTTESGLVFIGAAMDDYLRAFDVETGEELWAGRLPAGGQATPMSYRYEGRQYVVIAAGGHGRAGSTMGDSLVAFALPE
ncbi:MAG: pyrroloquinoline quinone-dependent dehydrogenase [Myxococcota bacterium]|nr:pyrroloquinoline quinone-dependent dehydrogenase [Myxococcota bacterium]